ncbi:MAG: protocatechuate 3,4-dioxygenase subunit alpha [Pseudomonadota bacterium]
MRSNTKLLHETSSQTAGPYVHIGLASKAAGFDMYDRELGSDIAGPHAAGDRITVEGIVWDGSGEPVKDVLIETWQANAAGLYAPHCNVEEGFRGWGRVISDFETGIWRFETVRPGPAAGNAPHISLWIVARGINIGLNTRMYFPEADNTADPVLGMLPPDQRGTLIAKRAVDDGAHRYRFDITLQGEGETVFFDI